MTETTQTADGGQTVREPVAGRPDGAAPRGLRALRERTLVRHLLSGLAALVVFGALSAAVPAYQDLQIAMVGAYVCAVAGLTALTGVNGQISLGHGALMAVGAYGTGLLLTDAGLTGCVGGKIAVAAPVTGRSSVSPQSAAVAPVTSGSPVPDSGTPYTTVVVAVDPDGSGRDTCDNRPVPS